MIICKRYLSCARAAKHQSPLGVHFDKLHPIRALHKQIPQSGKLLVFSEQTRFWTRKSEYVARITVSRRDYWMQRRQLLRICDKCHPENDDKVLFVKQDIFLHTEFIFTRIMSCISNDNTPDQPIDYQSSPIHTKYQLRNDIVDIKSINQR